MAKRYRKNERTARWLESLYARYHRLEMVEPDPLQFVLQYKSPADQEVVGLIASSLAYGNVTAINQSLNKIFMSMGGDVEIGIRSTSPASWLRESSPVLIRRTFSGFRYRVTDEHAFVGLLLGMRSLMREDELLLNTFQSNSAKKMDDDTAREKWLAMEGVSESILPQADVFVARVSQAAKHPLEHLLPRPMKGSACKRLMLFLRWMIRQDAVDTGAWSDLDTSKLIMPVDTHVYQMAKRLRWTKRKSVNQKFAIELTARLRCYCVEDPLRYDFCLTRPGIRKEDLP